MKNADPLDWILVVFFAAIGIIIATFVAGLMLAGGILVAGISWQFIQAAYGVFW